MKRIIALALALLLLATSPALAAKQTIDLETMNIDMLLELQSELEKAIERKQGGTQASPELQVSAEDLLDAFERNAVAAELKYKDQTIEVTGYISNIDRSLWGDELYVSLAKDRSDFNFETVDCYVQDSEVAKIAKLEKGKKITVVGVCEGKSFMSIELKDCVIK
jgi:hypothetical protein